MGEVTDLANCRVVRNFWGVTAPKRSRLAQQSPHPQHFGGGGRGRVTTVIYVGWGLNGSLFLFACMVGAAHEGAGAHVGEA